MFHRITRRRLVLSTGGTVLLGTPLAYLFSRPRRSHKFGPLQPDPAGLLDLPEGFSYQILERAGAWMSDGYRVPSRPDGMGCFTAMDGSLVLMRNHELAIGDATDYLPSGSTVPVEAFDALAAGGVSRVVVDPVTLARRSSNLVLAGTARNCAGGKTEGAWFSCEEDVSPGHGYVFACPIDADRVTALEPLRHYGRCRHEAAVSHPSRPEVYLTEDRSDGCLYRYDESAQRLEALCVEGSPRFEIDDLEVGHAPLPISWVAIDEPDPRGDTLRDEALAKGAAPISRGEGIEIDATGRVLVCATDGGPASAGQILAIDPDAGTLQVIAASEHSYVLEMPDNISMSPWGDLFLAEDGFGEDFIRGVTADGAVFDFARHAASSGEIAGVCFSPDGRAMFLNLQEQGLTLVVEGPFLTRSKASLVAV